MSTFTSLEAAGFVALSDGDIYATENSSIASGQNNQVVSLGGIGSINYLEIINDNTAASGHDLYVRLNAIGNNVIIVRAGETKAMRFWTTAIYLSNQCGSTINYRITMIGVSDT